MSSVNNVTKHEQIIEVWEQLDCESVGAKELAKIQQSVGERFGPGAVDSPAAIARLLADEGAVLRHPEVIDCDAEWRERGFTAFWPAAISFDDLKGAAAGLKALDEARQEFEAESRAVDLIRLREAVQNMRRDRQLLSHSRVVKESARLEAGEIAEWLGVWLKSPDLFFDWLELRQRSVEFLERFGREH